MHGHELDQWLVPPYGIDVLRHDDQQRPWWLSAEWIRSPRHYLDGRKVIDTLVANHRSTPGPLEPGEPADGFRAWLLATRPTGLTTAALGDPVWRIGPTHLTGAALTDLRTATETITAGDPGVAETLTAWATTWRNAGRPGLTELRPHLDPFHDGWTLRADADQASAEFSRGR
jgi:protein-L-isoaspartate(D-aspartate) O-methyltransferase